jgi:hypothetical protein
MKGFTLGLLAVVYALPSFAAGGVSRVVPSSDSVTTYKSTATGRVAIGDTDSKTSSSRTTTSRSIISTSSDMPAISRSITGTGVTSRSSVSGDARAKLDATVHTVGRSSRTDAASINANPAVRRLGLTLRPSTAEVGGRATIDDSGTQTGSNMKNEIRNMQSRLATVKTREEVKLDAAAIAEAKEKLEQTAALNKSCQEQYNDCMDQFCSVIDANQKRCSCSSNLSKYSKVEKAVKDANSQLNEVAQNIRYVGLSADEISAIMSATEAEEALSGTVDTTETRSMLTQIENMIKDPTTTSSSSYVSDSYGLLDIDLDFSSNDTSDLFSLDFLTDTSNGFSSLRGKDLYNAAKKRCATVISQCKEVGATSQQITGNYDLAIDKDCIAYEQGLTKMNETLLSNVRSATRMLQKARLAVMQNQNTYDARECIGALENCMTDDMVCGDDYAKCLDPTKQFIDENGNVVLGRNINYIQKFMENYNNADITQSFLSGAYGTAISNDNCATNASDGRCVVKYLLDKIGVGKKVTDGGLCRPVLDKCRAYTYDNGTYQPYNDVVRNYIQRAMVNIKSAQYKIVSDYASTCLNDIASCYNQQVSQVTSWAATASASSVYNIMRGACRNVALTCGYAVFSADQNSCPDDDQNQCIESISEIFYQSLLCPDNSSYVYPGVTNIDSNNKDGGYVNKLCKCQDGFVTFNGSCLPACENGGIYTSSGVCSEGAACASINNAGSATSSDTEDSLFWGGRCACRSNRYFYKSQCRTCPAHSEYISGLAGDIFGGQCQCQTGYKAHSSRLCCIDATRTDAVQSCDNITSAAEEPGTPQTPQL